MRPRRGDGTVPLRDGRRLCSGPRNSVWAVVNRKPFGSRGNLSNVSDLNAQCTKSGDPTFIDEKNSIAQQNDEGKMPQDTRPPPCH